MLIPLLPVPPVPPSAPQTLPVPAPVLPVIFPVLPVPSQSSQALLEPLPVLPVPPRPYWGSSQCSQCPPNSSQCPLIPASDHPSAPSALPVLTVPVPVPTSCSQSPPSSSQCPPATPSARPTCSQCSPVAPSPYPSCSQSLSQSLPVPIPVVPSHSQCPPVAPSVPPRPSSAPQLLPAIPSATQSLSVPIPVVRSHSQCPPVAPSHSQCPPVAPSVPLRSPSAPQLLPAVPSAPHLLPVPIPVAPRLYPSYSQLLPKPASCSQSLPVASNCSQCSQSCVSPAMAAPEEVEVRSGGAKGAGPGPLPSLGHALPATGANWGQTGANWEGPVPTQVLATLLRPRRGYNSTFRDLVFGKVFTDHMLLVEWSRAEGWGRPKIRPFQELQLHPASSALHYAVELFEGLKAFRGDDDKIRLFRPELNMERMRRSARRVCLPDFDGQEFLECIRALVRLEGRWVPRDPQSSLYIRPAFIGTEPTLGVSPPGRAMLFVVMCPVGPYFPGGLFAPIQLLADPQHVRAWPGGAGHCKLGGNYGPCLELQEIARNRGCHQVLWLYGPECHLTEVGTMNLFVFWERPDGGLELVTPPLDGLILPGVTRQSLLELARQWGEFEVREGHLPMSSVLGALQGGRLREMFGAGTACIVCPVGGILYKDELHAVPTMENGPEVTGRFLRELHDIQYGRVPSPWAQPV